MRILRLRTRADFSRNVQAALEAGFHRYLLKPIQYQELIDVLTPLAAKLDASINPIGFLDLAASAA
jgi:response regulator of citrate/malate metabolism